ncbi:hypothetical protein [uncultured Psychroserpens sp.]|uniref:hypothetical protein n=1 Tax=uncultured Psychroserpens sp. TaxID=255436 RepID=UPI002635050B|nr:hypothetical protein [uncultured Psychroserpens sp.]
MKTKFQLLFLFLLTTTLVTAQKQTDFLGKWLGDDGSEIGYLIFDKEGYAAFETQGQLIGGKEFVMNGEKGKMTYSINTEASPIEIDLTITKMSSGESKVIRCIAQFEEKDVMKFALAFDAERPKNFEGDNAIMLKRVK